MKPLYSFLPQLPFSAPFSLSSSVCVPHSVFTCMYTLMLSLSLSLCTPPYACGSFCLPTPSPLSLFLSLSSPSLAAALTAVLLQAASYFLSEKIFRPLTMTHHWHLKTVVHELVENTDVWVNINNHHFMGL